MQKQEHEHSIHRTLKTVGLSGLFPCTNLSEALMCVSGNSLICEMEIVSVLAVVTYLKPYTVRQINLNSTCEIKGTQAKLSQISYHLCQSKGDQRSFSIFFFNIF